MRVNGAIACAAAMSANKQIRRSAPELLHLIARCGEEALLKGSRQVLQCFVAPAGVRVKLRCMGQRLGALHIAVCVLITVSYSREVVAVI